MATIDLDDLTQRFKAAWEQADADGKAGERSRTALAAVFEYLMIEQGDVVIAQPPSYQGLTLWVGDTLPIYVDDTACQGELEGYLTAPIQRAVTITRLRLAADLIEGGA